MEKDGEDIYGNQVYRVKIAEKPVNGEANKGLIKALSDYFNVPQRNVSILSGETSRDKLIEIL